MNLSKNEKIFCVRCGKQLIETKQRVMPYYSDKDGKKVLFYERTFVCPNKRWYNLHSYLKFNKAGQQIIRPPGMIM